MKRPTSYHLHYFPSLLRNPPSPVPVDKVLGLSGSENPKHLPLHHLPLSPPHTPTGIVRRMLGGPFRTGSYPHPRDASGRTGPSRFPDHDTGRLTWYGRISSGRGTGPEKGWGGVLTGPIVQNSLPLRPCRVGVPTPGRRRERESGGVSWTTSSSLIETLHDT